MLIVSPRQTRPDAQDMDHRPVQAFSVSLNHRHNEAGYIGKIPVVISDKVEVYLSDDSSSDYSPNVHWYTVVGLEMRSLTNQKGQGSLD